MDTVVGILRDNGRGGVVESSGKNRLAPVSVSAQDLNGAPYGMLVVAQLLTPPDALSPRGKILEVLGDPGRSDVAIKAIIREHGLHEGFPDGVMRAAARIPAELPDETVADEIRLGRRDLRELATLTIDGKEAKDLDDAISIEAMNNGSFRLWVHIADVTHYVKEDAALDREALLRGNSVYLVDRVLPMLPPRLSNGICSLNPAKDRLTLTCEMTVSAEGELGGGDVYESVIRSDLRANYVDVFAALQGVAVLPEYKPFLDLLRHMETCARLLRKNRSQAGNLNFNFPETHVDLDAEGHPVAIYPYPINEANEIIEEFMIAANRTVARLYRAKKAPFIYRVHEDPDPEKLQRFLNTAKLLGLRFKIKGKPTTRQLGEILDQIQGTAEEAILGQLLLQSLAKARYDAECLGHFGLAIADYCHFTSPIRRYPDLFIHRVIKGYLHEQPHNRKWRKRAPEVALHCSDTEREAMYAEFDSVDRKAAEYMQAHLGEHYLAHVSGMISAGMFIQLDNTVEGMIPFRTMDDYYVFDEQTLTARGRHNGKVYKLGQPVEVVVANVSLERRQIDFMLPADWQKSALSQQLGLKLKSQVKQTVQAAADVKTLAPAAETLPGAAAGQQETEKAAKKKKKKKDRWPAAVNGPDRGFKAKKNKKHKRKKKK
ncbi:ribonuclease R [Oscillospiraceae bacterium HV4-5-C5C]|nr:ribonuclease R [Oscillospiraceae bacterium HV4-5-C5C]